MKQWEYRTGKAAEATELGEEGWELVTVTLSGTHGNEILWFKRPLEEKD